MSPFHLSRHVSSTPNNLHNLPLSPLALSIHPVKCVSSATKVIYSGSELGVAGRAPHI